jgi:decaprenylphospho-beta-D-erythro-pentofuranosid-2-ulose 2-reductase
MNDLRTILVVGATSGIGEAVCRILAGRGWDLVVTGRDPARIQTLAADLVVRGAGRVESLVIDAVRPEEAAACVDRAAAAVGGPLDGVIVCHGWAPPERGQRLSAAEIRGVIDANFTSAAVILSAAAAHLEAHAGKDRHAGGFLAVISSVAGDRGRPSNFTYGSAKAGLTAFASGLRGRLHGKGIAVLTVKPGFVDTPMLRKLGVKPSPLVATPQHVAATIVRAIDRRCDVLYTPWFWRWIMLAVRLIPEPLFKRLGM